MEEDIDYRTALHEARQKVEGMARNGDAVSLDAYWEVCCGDVLVAEENRDQTDKLWENASLAEELLDIAAYLEGYDSMIDNLFWAVSRMAETISDHPRLTLRILEFQQLLLDRIEALHDHELDMSEDIQSKIFLYRRNIERADRGEFDLIEPIGHLKSDPIEWSSDYERLIDEVDKKVYALLEDYPRGMGFCLAYWHCKGEVLREYGIEWRSLAEMNPRVLFD